MKFRQTTSSYTYSCPNCKNVVKVKTKTDSEALTCILVLLWPIGLIVLLIKLISNAVKEKSRNNNSEIMICSRCGAKLALDYDAHTIKVLNAPLQKPQETLLSREESIDDYLRRMSTPLEALKRHNDYASKNNKTGDGFDD